MALSQAGSFVPQFRGPLKMDIGLRLGVNGGRVNVDTVLTNRKPREIMRTCIHERWQETKITTNRHFRRWLLLALSHLFFALGLLKHVFEATSFLGNAQIQHLSHGLPRHRLACLGHEPTVHLLDAPLWHFSDPLLDFSSSCLVIFRLRPQRAKKVTSIPSSVKCEAICLTLEYGHLHDFWPCQDQANRLHERTTTTLFPINSTDVPPKFARVLVTTARLWCDDSQQWRWYVVLWVRNDTFFGWGQREVSDVNGC